MMKKLMPILAKAVVLPAVLAISTLGGNAQTLNHAVDEIVPVNFDQQLIALDYKRGVVVLDLAANQILDVAEIQSVDHLDIIALINR
jgi:hypothetical protein